VIFSNILDVHSFSILFLSMLEDTVEMTEKEQIPLIGGCFEELFEVSRCVIYSLTGVNNSSALNITCFKGSTPFALYNHMFFLLVVIPAGIHDSSLLRSPSL